MHFLHLHLHLLSNMPPPVLPPEMISEILAGVNDKADLLALRLTSREFRRLATRKAFRCITVTPTTSSAQNLMQLQGCDELAKYIQEIRFNGDIIYEGQSLDPYRALGPIHNSYPQMLTPYRLPVAPNQLEDPGRSTIRIALLNHLTISL